MEKASFEIALKGKKLIAERTYEFIFEKPQEFHFNAGQHVRMTLLNPPETDSKGNSRFLTLANTPKDKDLIVAMRMTDSAFKRVLGKMQIGEKVLIQILLHSPHGSFVIHDDPSIPAVFLIGGIGIVPAYSMIKDAIERKLPHKIFLFYSNRRPEDAPYLDELQNLAKQNPKFTLIATMTQMEKSKKSWQGETGFIDQVMLKKYLGDLKSPIYYTAGLSEMVNAMKALLKEIGINEESIHSEDFSNFKMSMMNMTDNSKRIKNYFLFGGIGLMIILGVIVHSSLAVLLFNAFSLKNLSYFTIGIILVIIIFKILVIFKFKHHLGFKHGEEK
ncbi:MAG: FAD-dependent oxidoreductase [Candidatus Daviesbacteria bacterium]|nr:MAG: FAD-dependent oxidoreductase [Candidatus Daviesbacteria bacterium]